MQCVDIECLKCKGLYISVQGHGKVMVPGDEEASMHLKIAGQPGGSKKNWHVNENDTKVLSE